MRWDSEGVLWNEPRKKTRKSSVKKHVSDIRPPVPETGWVCPREFPNLSAAKVISIDLETRDPNLREKGPGPRRKEQEGGFIAGLAVGVGAGEGEQWYFPMRHEDGKHNFDPDMVMLWAKDALKGPQPKLGANILYDLDWLAEEGVEVGGYLHDVLLAEPLINENAFSYSLGRCGQKYCQDVKQDREMYEWLSLAFGGNATRKDQAGRIWRAPAKLVGPYAESDVRLPFQVWEQQQKVIQRQSLDTVYDVECRLLPLLLAMRRRGVRVDVERAEETDAKMQQLAQRYRQELGDVNIDPLSPDSLTAYCDRNGIRYAVTGLNNPSFRGNWLRDNSDENLRKVYEVRRLEKHAGTFLEGAIMGHAIDGRIYCQFNQLRSDEYGTVSGRFSSSNPNLQNIPARDEELGPLIRSMFLPEEGEEWVSDDYSQIEYKLLVHYARGRGAKKARQQYRDNPDTDFHAYAAELTSIDRTPAKSINFGLVYGMGEFTMAANLGRPLEEVKPLFKMYHDSFPFVKDTFNTVSKRAMQRGFIHTLLGRRRRFDMWESRDWQLSREQDATTEKSAEELWGMDSPKTARKRKDGTIAPPGIRRAYTNKALNALLQGGAADVMKKAMVDVWESGVCDVLGAPLITVHDELNWSRPKTKEALQAHAHALHLMKSCVDLRVPLTLSSGVGENWGDAK